MQNLVPRLSRPKLRPYFQGPFCSRMSAFCYYFITFYFAIIRFKYFNSKLSKLAASEHSNIADLHTYHQKERQLILVAYSQGFHWEIDHSLQYTTHIRLEYTVGQIQVWT